MRYDIKSVAIALFILIIFTAVPLGIQQMIPSEFLNFLSVQGLNLPDLLNQLALIGLALTVLALLKGFTEKTSLIHLALSMFSNLFLLFLTFFALGLGSIENLGVTVISSEIGGSLNTITLDLKLFIYLATLTIILKMIHSFLQYRAGKDESI